MLTVFDCKTEHRKNPVGLDAVSPRFSWKIASDRQDVMQKSYRIVVEADGALLWDSGLVESGDSQNIRYRGVPLTSGTEASWTVTVSDGEEAAVSEPAHFEMGLLRREDWQAMWIEPEDAVDYDLYKPAPCLRREFDVRPGLVKARIYQSAHGLYRFWINGVPGSEEKFTPGLTSYHQRVQYQTCDITALLAEGRNAWAVQLADGWWRGNTGGGNRNNFGFKLSFVGQIVLTYADGSREIIGTDTAFRTSYGGLRSSDMKIGDTYDARLEPDGWQCAGFDDAAWKNVHAAAEFPAMEALVPSRSAPVLEREEFIPAVFRDGEGNLVLDFGQNLAGYVRMTLRCAVPGQQVVLHHGEALKDGVFSIANIENSTDEPFQQVRYTCKGGAEERYCPWSSVFGFRYVKLEGYPESNIRPGDFVAVAVYSALEETGSFRCSNPLVNQLVSNSRWSQKGNFLDVPTDCPTRERSAWSGDSQVYVKTASEFMDVYPFFEKWLMDLNLEQFEDGCVGNTFPSTNSLHNPAERERMIEQGRFVFIAPELAGPKGCGSFLDGAAGWGDTAAITPMTLYLCYGDKAILEQQYQSAKNWVNFCRRNAAAHNPLYEDQPAYHTYTDGVLDADYIYDTHFHWGEWLEPDAVENGGPTSFSPPELAKKGNPLVATPYLYHSCDLVAQMAALLGYDADAADFSAYAANVKRVYNKYFIQPDGTILEGRQAPYARTLAFGLATEENAPKVAAKLAEAVETNGYHLNTGFLSTPFLLQQLVRYGYPEHAFRLLEQTDNPSWLHPVTLGSTTILENWGGMDDFSGSFNHYSYGAVCDFLFGCVAGIQPVMDAPGYRHFQLRPTTGGTLTEAEAVYESIYGTIRSGWKIENGAVTYRFTIPANTTATMYLPGRDPIELGSGSYTF